MRHNENFTTRVRQVGHGERHCSQCVAPGNRRGARICRARDAAGTAGLEPGRHWGRPHRRRRQGNRSQTLRVRLSCSRSPELAAGHFACDAAAGSGRDTRLRRHRSFAPERCVEALGGGYRHRPRANGHARSRILRRRSPLSGRQDAALSRAAGGAVDLRRFRHLRSGAARPARPGRPEIRRTDRPRLDAQLRPSFDSRA